MTTYKNLTWERLSELLEEFHLEMDFNKQFKLNGIMVYCNRIDVYPTRISCYEEGWEYMPTFGDDDWDSDIPYCRDIIKYEYIYGSKFDLIIGWEEFEIKMRCE